MAVFIPDDNSRGIWVGIFLATTFSPPDEIGPRGQIRV